MRVEGEPRYGRGRPLTLQENKTSDSASQRRGASRTAGHGPASSSYHGYNELHKWAVGNDDTGDTAMQSGDPYFGDFSADIVEGGFGLPGSYGNGGGQGDPKGGSFAGMGTTYLDDLEDAFLSTSPDMDTDGGLLFSKPQPQQHYESPFAPSRVDNGPPPGTMSLSTKNVRSLPSFVPTFEPPFQGGLGALPSGPTQWKAPPQQSPLPSSSMGHMGAMQQDAFGGMDDTASVMSSDSSLAGGHLPWHSDQSISSGMGGLGLGGSMSSRGLDALPSVKRRAERNAREQKRSLKITEQISHLKDVLSCDGRPVKNSKMAILVEVEDYIKELEVQVSGLDVAGQSSAAAGGGMDMDQDLKVDVLSGGVVSGGSSRGGGAQVTPGVDDRTLFKHVCVPMAVASTDGRFIDVNARFESVVGTSRDELEKLTFFNLLAKEELQDAFTTVALMLQGLTPDTSFTRLLESRPGKPRMYITVSLVREGTTPKHFNCWLHR